MDKDSNLFASIIATHVIFINFVLVSQGCEPFVAYCSLCIGQTSTMSSGSGSETPQDRSSMLESRVVKCDKS